MLTAQQITRIAGMINSHIDIPLVSESLEQDLIEKAITIVDVQLEKLLPGGMKDFLQELKPGDGLDRAHCGSFIERLVTALNKRIDIPFLGEKQEEKLIRTVAELLVKTMSNARSLDDILKTTA